MKISDVSRTLQNPKREKKMIQSFLSNLRQQGFGPREDFKVRGGKFLVQKSAIATIRKMC